MSEELEKKLEVTDEPAALLPPEHDKSMSEPEEQESVSKEEESSCCRSSLLKSLFVPWGESVGKHKQVAPFWLLLLCGISLLVMLNQVKIPIAGGRIAFADLAFVIAFVPVFLYSFIQKRGLFFPLCAVLSLTSIAVTNIIAGSGMSGAFEVAQLVQQLICGVALFSFLVDNAPGLAGGVVFLSLLINIAVAFLQVNSFGFGSVLPPADVLKLKWGFGGAYTGLFRSRMALSFFLASGLALIQPVIFGRKGCWLRMIGGYVLAVLFLSFIAHGQILVIACLVLLVGAFIHSRRAGITNALAIATVLVLINAVYPQAHGSALLSSMNPMKTGDYPGELKTNHIDFAAALKMAAKRPLYGVGSGRYQQCVGRCYEDLPNPSYNDIDTDTQASWGILAGTAGFPAAALFLLLFASSCASGIRRYVTSNGENTIALGGALVLSVVILGMFVTDPLTRGLGWMVALGLAAAAVPNRSDAISSLWRISPAALLVVTLCLGILLGITAIRKKVDDPLKSNRPEVATERPNTGALSPTSAAVEDASIFLIVDASEVASITPPVEKGSDSQAAKNAVLKILDGKGTPPDGKEPAMEYGGAVFNVELPAEAECKIWLRVWWDGSCGNTINIKVDDEPKSITVGNDGTYKTWHWLEAPKLYNLSKGKHVVTLLNREDGIMFDQMLITNDKEYYPQGIEE